MMIQSGGRYIISNFYMMADVNCVLAYSVFFFTLSRHCKGAGISGDGPDTPIYTCTYILYIYI